MIQGLKDIGFEVETNVAGMETAFIGRWGHGNPKIGVLAEFDALAGLSQVSELPERKPLKEGEAGHGCGHNSIGPGSMLAVAAAKDYLEKHNMPGSIVYYGCCAEEAGAGKMFMARAKVFDELDACLSWHPGGGTYIRTTASSAVIALSFAFNGKSSHAAGTPHLGRSALDACELTSVGVNYLREHIIPEARVHYAYTDAGGKAPNVVQAHAEVKYMVRAPKIAAAKEIAERVINCAKGAALMTGTTLNVNTDYGISDFIANHEIGMVMQEALDIVGGPRFDEDDYALATKFKEIADPGELKAFLKRLRSFYPDIDEYEDKVLVDKHSAYVRSKGRGPGSTDIGDVSYSVPLAYMKVAGYAVGTEGHTWQMTAQNGTQGPGVCCKSHWYGNHIFDELAGCAAKSARRIC